MMTQTVCMTSISDLIFQCLNLARVQLTVRTNRYVSLLLNFSTLKPTVGTMSSRFCSSGMKWFSMVDFPELSSPTTSMLHSLNWHTIMLTWFRDNRAPYGVKILKLNYMVRGFVQPVLTILTALYWLILETHLFPQPQNIGQSVEEAHAEPKWAKHGYQIHTCTYLCVSIYYRVLSSFLTS